MRRVEVICDGCGATIAAGSATHLSRPGADGVEDACDEACAAQIEPASDEPWASAASVDHMGAKSTKVAAIDTLRGVRDPLPYILDEAELAKRLRLTVRGLQHMRKRGMAPAFVRFRRIVRYDWRDVEAWLAERKVGSGEKLPRSMRKERAA